MVTKEEAFIQVSSLVERFTEQLPTYKKNDYNEALTRKDFIDPFFNALGWDMNNSNGYAEAYREVIHEDKLKIGSATKAPDYSFRLPGGKRLFFVEAKKPSVYIKDEILPAYQVRRYAWSAKLPVSILTDFEEFAVYDCKKKPDISDKASVSRIKYITYKDYLTDFDFIWDNFSKEKVLKGGFDKYVQSDSNKKGTSTVDKEFLVSLDEWRKELAQNIALRNSSMNEDEINYTVQQTIDRLIFLRIAEDRGVEEYGKLKAAITGKEYYQNLFKYFKEADSKYNSGLFDFKKDKISAEIVLDNKIIKNILNELYYPVSPYEFSVLSVEILGSAYEQFLGKQIRLTASHKAVIEEKPEVRKAGGVYYTPEYIVEYIVKNTVGKLINGKTLDEIKKLKIVDPACGSGSFLIGAYQYLLNYHQEYYKPKFDELTKIAASNEYNTKQRTEAQKERNRLPLTPEGNLITSEKKQILLNNIFGVDIDAQAVEVTKLSLMLKCMEGETKSSINAQINFGERVLPTLDDNIKSGNSLIDTDFYDGQLDFEPEIEKKIKPFNWEKAFTTIFKQGGFDGVIGNPPYSLIGTDRKAEQDYFGLGKYELNSYKINTYILFLERGLKLLKPKGAKLGFIIPKSLVFNTYFESTRKNLLKNYLISEMVEIREKVFEDAEVGDSLLFFGEKNDNPLNNPIQYFKVKNIAPLFTILNSFETKQNILLTKFQGRFYPSGLNIRIKTQQLNEYCGIYNGLNPGNVRHLLLSSEKENSNYKKMVLGRDIHRYGLSWSGTWVNYDQSLKNKIKSTQIKSKTGMTAQTKVDFALRDESIYLGDKILVRKTSDHLISTFDHNNFYYDSLSYGIKLLPEQCVSILFILGLLNTSLLNYIHESLANNKEKVFAKVLAVNLSKLPFPIISLKDEKEKKAHDGIVHLVETMLQLQKEKRQTNLPDKLNQLETRIEYTDDKINKLVYELYGLNEEEVRIVERV